MFFGFLIFAIMGCSEDEVSISFSKAPHLLFMNYTNMGITWQLSETALCTVRWGTNINYSFGEGSSSEISPDHFHKFVISDIQPHTKYYYKVIQATKEHTGSFYSHQQAVNTNVSFFIYGDTRTGVNQHNIICSNIIHNYTTNSNFQSFVLHAGDMVNSGNEAQSWAVEFFDLSMQFIKEMIANIPVIPVPGNHEGDQLLFRKYFPYPDGKNWYSFEYGPVRIILVNQYVAYSPGSDQHNFIKDTIIQSSAAWNILLMHDPGWSSGNHPNNTNVQNWLHPLCQTNNVSLVIAGHNHYYSRAVVDDIQYITTGGGGAPLRTPENGWPYVVTKAASYHFCKVTVSENLLKFDVVNEQGSTIDTFTLVK